MSKEVVKRKPLEGDAGSTRNDTPADMSNKRKRITISSSSDKLATATEGTKVVTSNFYNQESPTTFHPPLTCKLLNNTNRRNRFH
jgi:hypothetical protein